MSLPLIALPHMITSSLALSLLSDLMPRFSHSNPSIRKKTVAAVYRLALVYPDTLRPAWPKIKDILMDESEDTSVTAAVVNVVCELGWRRPQDFLALAPRLFDLLIESGNNWMAIKIIKLFAILTPLEPRLIRKLLPPLINLIRTTPAMSLLYECINGIIQGGILDGGESGAESDEIASLCVEKLRGMVVIEGDPNLKYVALLAFNRIVNSHPHLVSIQEDVIMSCIDDADISIRLQALELGAGMVNSDNLVTVVERLLKQLRNAPPSIDAADAERGHAAGVEPAADSDGEDPEEALRPAKESSLNTPNLPLEYRITVIRQILKMCCADTYAFIVDFDWYIKILIQLVKLVPYMHHHSMSSTERGHLGSQEQSSSNENIAASIGWELRNVAVRVSMMRTEAVQAAETLIMLSRMHVTSMALGIGGLGVLPYAAWIVGEYAPHCANPQSTLDVLLGTGAVSLPPDTTCAYVQAIPKIFAHVVSKQTKGVWDRERKTTVNLLLSRIIDFLEPLSVHPYLEVQERAVEFLELMRIASQAIASDRQYNDKAPFLLTEAIANLFAGSDLNPVAPSAQQKVPLPAGLDLETPINFTLPNLLSSVGPNGYKDTMSADFQLFYREKVVNSSVGSARDNNSSRDPELSYQQAEHGLLNPEDHWRKRMLRRERHKDDPFYITGDDSSSGVSTPFHDILQNSNLDGMDLDSIPIMNLDLGDKVPTPAPAVARIRQPKPRRPKKVHVVKDETIDQSSGDQSPSVTAITLADSKPSHHSQSKAKRSLLKVDSSNLNAFSLSGSTDEAPPELAGLENQEREMERALAEVERHRLEMQRASERIQVSEGTPADGTFVKKKKKKKLKQPESEKAPVNLDSPRLAAKPKVKRSKKQRMKLEKEEEEKYEELSVKEALDEKTAEEA